MSRNLLIVYAFIITLIISSSCVEAQDSSFSSQISHLSVKANPLKLNAGHNTTVTVTVINDFEPIYDLDVKLQFTIASPIILGTSHWKYSKLEKGSNVSLQAVIYVPDEDAGNGYTANVYLLYKRLGYISPYSEIHTIGFYAKGFIDIVVYDFSMEPDPANIGENVAITASILNKGNIPAMFTNVSLLTNPAIVLKPESFSYLGQVDPNSPAPFTVEAKVDPEIIEGEYVLKLLISYEDDESAYHTLERQLTLAIIEGVVYNPPTTQERIFSVIQQWFLLIIVAVLILTIVAVVVSVYKRRGEEKEFESF